MSLFFRTAPGRSVSASTPPEATTRTPQTPFAIRYLLYPVLAVVTVLYVVAELAEQRTTGHPPGHWYGTYLAFIVTAMLVCEWCYPMQLHWSMRASTFWRRDVLFLLLGAVTLAGVNFLATATVMWAGWIRPSALAGLPTAPGAVVAILLADFLWYWLHRACHAAQGRLGGFLWRVHVAHHLPAQVYVFMHAIGHPLNLIAVRAILVVPVHALGLSSEAAFVAAVVTGFQGLISHFNVDSRVGWLNYVLMGTELHRYHHSADPVDAGNFAAVTSIWDQIFGTFRYVPGRAPADLGVTDPAAYPADTAITDVLVWPFRR